MSRNFMEMLQRKWADGKFVCVGLDSEYAKIPEDIRGAAIISRAIETFNARIVGATKDVAAAYKPNIAFYEEHGAEGFAALQETIRHIRLVAPDVPVILDAKRADIGNTNNGYVKMAFSYMKADAITVHPYLGKEALQPFLDCKDKGVFVLCRTSNPGAREFQDLVVTKHSEAKLYEYVAYQVGKEWNSNNCGLVVGATYPHELLVVRSLTDMPILIPGIGAQGGDLEKTVLAAQKNFLVNSSRGIIFAADPRQATLELHESITKIHKKGPVL